MTEREREVKKKKGGERERVRETENIIQRARERI